MKQIFKFKLEDGTVVTGANPVEALMQVKASTTGKALDTKFKKEKQEIEKSVAMLEFENLYGNYLELEKKIKGGEKIKKAPEVVVNTQEEKIDDQKEEEQNKEAPVATTPVKLFGVKEPIINTEPEPELLGEKSEAIEPDSSLDAKLEEEDLKNLSAEKLFELVENEAKKLTNSVSTIYYILSGYDIGGRITKEQNKAVLKMIAEKYPDGNTVTNIIPDKIESTRQEIENIMGSSKESEAKNIFSEIGLPPRDRQSVDPYDENFVIRSVVQEDINDVLNMIKDIDISSDPALIDPIILNEQAQEIKLLKEKGVSQEIVEIKNKVYADRNKQKIAESYVNYKYKLSKNDLVKSLEDRISKYQLETKKVTPVNTEVKSDIEQLNVQQIKNEVEKIIRGSFLKKLEEKKLEYLGTDIIATKNGFQIEVNLKGDWKRGKPKFIADIISVNGNIIVNDYKLDANPLVKAFVNKDDIDGLASTMGDSIKKYIETDRKKEIERLDIEDGILKVTYKS